VGHTCGSGCGRTAFASALAAAGYQWTVALCLADSDHDGQTNGQELGDPCCVWTQGAAQYPSVSNPGAASSKQSTPPVCASPPPPLAPPPPASPPPPPAPPAPPSVPAYSASFCSQEGSFCMAWAVTVSGGGSGRRLASSPQLLHISLSAQSQGYVSLGWSDLYGSMSPADVWTVGVVGGTFSPLTHYRNADGHAAPAFLFGAVPGAALLSASYAAGELLANLTLPLPASPRARNLIWCTGAFDGTMAVHGGRSEQDYGSAELDLLCTPGSSACVLRVGSLRGFTQLDRIALAGFGATLGAAALARWALGRGGAAARAALHFPLSRALRLPLPDPPARWGFSELLLLAGYAVTFALYLREALHLFPGDAAHAVGTLLAPSFSLALLPVARDSPLLWLLGASYERAAASHRALTSAAVALVAVHIGLTAQTRGVSALALRAENESGKGNVFGTAAAALMGTMALLSSPPVRAASHALFKASHLLLFPVVLLLACLHATMMIGYIVPPLVLWAVDRALAWRRAATAHPARVTRLPGGAVRLEVFTAAPMRMRAGQFAYVCVPSASLQWHPFTLACDPAAADHATFVIGDTGGARCFARRLAALCPPGAEQAEVRARLDGPVGRAPLPLRSYASVLLVCGGVGITPAVSLLADLLGEKGAGARLALLWSVREAEAAAAWLPGWLERMSRVGVEVTVAVTGGGGALARPGGAISFQAGRPDVGEAVADAVAAARERGLGPHHVAVFACGPAGLVAAAAAAGDRAGAVVVTERFTL